MSGESLDVQNSTMVTSTCDCNQITNGQETAPTNAPSEGSGDASSATSGATSRK